MELWLIHLDRGRFTLNTPDSRFRLGRGKHAYDVKQAARTLFGINSVLHVEKASAALLPGEREELEAAHGVSVDVSSDAMIDRARDLRVAS